MSKICQRCNIEYNNNMISPKYLSKNIDKYKFCKSCRKFKICKNCNMEFNHHQNKTCSKECAQELKEKSWIESCGSNHNFCKNSKSRLVWENKLMIEEGITNVFQRNDVKEKSKKKIKEKFGVDNISKSPHIKEMKKKTLDNTMKINPTLFKEHWNKTHQYFLKTIGYDPRLHVFGKSSKESLIIFNNLIIWCLKNEILSEDIYIGTDNKKEYFISIDNKIFFYDFTIRSKKIIIEYNGIAFHAKPDSKEWRNPFTNESIEDNLIKSKIKKDAALNKGFKILEIWSDENPIINLELCKKFIISNI